MFLCERICPIQGPQSNQSVIGGRHRLISLLFPRRMLWVIRIINTLSRSLQSPAIISNLSLGISFSYQTLASCLQGSIHTPSRLPTGPAPDTHTPRGDEEIHLHPDSMRTLDVIYPKKINEALTRRTTWWGERERKSFLALDFSRVPYKWHLFLIN